MYQSTTFLNSQRKTKKYYFVAKMFYFTFFCAQVAGEGTNTLIHHPNQGLSFQNNVSTALSS